MDIQIVENMKENLQIIIYCRQIGDEVMRLKSHIELSIRSCRQKR